MQYERKQNSCRGCPCKGKNPLCGANVCSKMANDKEMAQSAHAKRCHDRVPSTPGRSSCSPAKKQSKKLLEDPQIDQKQNVQIVNPEIRGTQREKIGKRLRMQFFCLS